MKIALVHHCNYGIECMTDKSWCFNADEVNCLEGDFVVTENFPNGKVSLVIGWIEKIKENEEENPTSKIIVCMRNYPRPMTDTEFDRWTNEQFITNEVPY